VTAIYTALITTCTDEAVDTVAAYKYTVVRSVCAAVYSVACTSSYTMAALEYFEVIISRVSWRLKLVYTWCVQYWRVTESLTYCSVSLYTRIHCTCNYKTHTVTMALCGTTATSAHECDRAAVAY
jgi:hypothetical protein